MSSVLDKLIGKAKGGSYRADADISAGETFGILYERGMMAMRGMLRKPGLKKSEGLLFIGRRVRLKFAKRISIGAGSTIHDDCCINALSRSGVKIGKGFSLGRNSLIDCTGVLSELGESICVGDYVGISPNFTAFVRGPVIIGSDTIIGPNVTIVSENHVAETPSIPIRKQGTSRKGVTIGENCWLGANVTILDGVTIGDGAIIAAGAVVNSNVEAYSIVGGVPARLLKRRIETTEIETL